MGYTVIIAEKPSVAASIAKIVGANTPHREKANGYLEGNGYKVTWAFGHLVGLKNPEDMGFGGETLPIMPEKWETQVIKSPKADLAAMTNKQMKVIDGLFGGADRIIVATDAGREGELIFRYIYEYLGCRTPFDRLWISSLTDEAIRKGMASLLGGRQMNALSQAAHARSEADWLVGFNASRALRLSSGSKKNLSLGRVQTPVLVMITQRYEENKNFVPTPYWQVTGIAVKGQTGIPVVSVHHYQTEAEAVDAMGRVKNQGSFKVNKVETKDVTSKPPLLHDLTSLQRIANSKYGLTAEETLKIAQSLYEKKYMTYPRTGSRYVPEDVFATIPGLIAKVAAYDRDSFRAASHSLQGKKLCRRSVDDSKVTDHHALLPTEVIPKDLSGNEQKIWELVCGRMLEAFGENSISKRTTVELESAFIPFKISGSVMVYPGWKAVFGAAEAADEEKKGKTEGQGNEDDTPDAGQIPPLKEGENLPATKLETVRKTDNPPAIYTDSSLLGEMETCGKKIDDEELREQMKDIGLGTPATRAAIIEVLIRRGYVSRTGKKLIPTELGMEIAHIVKGRKIADVRTTGEWERELSRIENGKASKESFDQNIRKYVLDIIEDLRTNCKPLDGMNASSEPVRTCPVCGHKMVNRKYDVFCDDTQGGCGMKINREIAGKKLPVTAINQLAEGKTTGTVKGFKSKAGKAFDAKLTVNREAKKVEFVFNESRPTADLTGKTCPCCGQPMSNDTWKLTCGCGFTLFKAYGQVPLTESEIDKLLEGKAVPKAGMKSKAGKSFNAKLVVNKQEKKIDFIFDKK
jgi:DNA topoisomerase-3